MVDRKHPHQPAPVLTKSEARELFGRADWVAYYNDKGAVVGFEGKANARNHEASLPRIEYHIARAFPALMIAKNADGDTPPSLDVMGTDCKSFLEHLKSLGIRVEEQRPERGKAARTVAAAKDLARRAAENVTKIAGTVLNIIAPPVPPDPPMTPNTAPLTNFIPEPTRKNWTSSVDKVHRANRPKKPPLDHPTFNFGDDDSPPQPGDKGRSL